MAFFDLLLMTTYWVKHSLESFTIFTSSAMVTCRSVHNFRYNALQHDNNHIGMTCSLRYRKSIWNKETEIKYCCYPFLFCSTLLKFFAIVLSSLLSYLWVLKILNLTPKMSQVFPQQNNLISQSRLRAVNKVVNFKDFQRPNKEILLAFQGP